MKLFDFIYVIIRNKVAYTPDVCTQKNQVLGLGIGLGIIPKPKPKPKT